VSFGATDWEMGLLDTEPIVLLREGAMPRGESMTAAAATVTPIQPARRMSLAAVVSGKIKAPYRITLHGPDGVGKSSFAANAPKPIFLGSEDGTTELDVKRFPTPDGGLAWPDVLEAVRELTHEAHDYKTFALDTLDWAEPLLFADVCKKADVKSIEDVGGGFGKGYVAALDRWRSLLAALELLQAKRGMHVILIAHSFIKNFKNPLGDDFDRFVLKLHDKSAALIREWSKGVYFAAYEEFAVREKKDRAETAKGVSTGARVLFTQRRAAYDAKDRYGLPGKLPLNWDEFDKLATVGSDPAVIRAEVERKTKEVEGEIQKKAVDALARAGTDTQKLAQLNDWLNGKINEKAEKEAA
jgi:hypothetical protein